jgi:hypothetical protein
MSRPGQVADLAQEPRQDRGIFVWFLHAGQMPRAPDQVVARAGDQLGHLLHQIGRGGAIGVPRDDLRGQAQRRRRRVEIRARDGRGAARIALRRRRFDHALPRATAGLSRKGLENHRSMIASDMAERPCVSTIAMRSSHMARVPILGAVFDRTTARTRSSRLAASPCAIMPPMERPTKTTSRSPNASITRSASRTSAPIE